MTDTTEHLTRTLRKALLAILLIGNVGVAGELLLLKHTDGVWQWIPLVLVASSLLAIGWCVLSCGRASLRTLQVVMSLCVLSSGIGVIQHFRGNLVYASESNPSLAGWELYREAIVGATPALAPGAMLQLGLIGLVFAYRHPNGRRSTSDHTHSHPRSS